LNLTVLTLQLPIMILVLPNPLSDSHSHHPFPAPPPILFRRSAEQVAPELIGCLLLKRQPSGELLWGVLVETEAYSQEEPTCHGYLPQLRGLQIFKILRKPGAFARKDCLSHSND